MKLSLLFASITLICMTATGFGQKKCELNNHKVDQSRYFIVLAGRSGVFYDRSGPTFPMLIKLDGREIQVDAVGIYFSGGKPHFGIIPEDSRNEFVVLRLEINEAQYERGLKIVRTWERRVREAALLLTSRWITFCWSSR